MAENSKIEWTDATWNPTVGCSIVSPECLNCYAMLMAHRLANIGQEKYQGLTQIVQQGSNKGKPVWNGMVRLDRDSLDIPMKRKKPTLYFVNSMSDLFHESLSHDDICQVWSQMVVADWHTYQVLTKRPHVAKQFVNAWIAHMRAESMAPVKNIWLGTSVGVKAAKRRIDFLRETNAAVRFLSCEPLLEDLGELDLTGIHWVIVGGESGPNARPMHPDWARSVRDQCKAAGVPFFFKQWGEWLGTSPFDKKPEADVRRHEWNGGVTAWRVGKKAAGRLLDGKEHSEYPSGRRGSGEKDC